MPVRPKPTRQSNPRPINKQDSSAKFPNRLTYPNGTYASTGSIGGTGSFGANLPVVVRNNSNVPNNHLSNPLRVFQNTSPIPNVQSPYATTQAQGSFVSGSGQVNLQGVTTGGRGNMNPTTTDRINAYAQQAVQSASLQPAPRPTDGQYIPGVNDDAWISYWNKVPLGTPPPNIMSRDQIWNMKANQRRRRNAEREQDDQNRQYSERASGQVQAKPEPTYQPFFTKTVGFRTGTG